jgi:N-acetylmuramoyl-L-alanine amidase
VITIATPMTPSQVVAQLKKWGVPFKEVKSWGTHNRDAATGKAWGPLNGFIWHHTGADVSQANAASYAGSTLYNGLSNLPGPLCHFGLAPDGTVYLVGWGRANHAGGGDPAVLNHVINEDYSGQLKPTKGNSNGVDGNDHFYGVEIMYSGSHKMTDAQYKAALKLSAAILDFHKWTEKSVIAHGEWSNDKWDPGYASGKIMDMVTVRKDVLATLKAGPKPTTTTPSKPTVPTTPSAGGATVATKTAGYREVWDLDVATPPKGHETASNQTWAPMSILKGIYENLDALAKKVDELSKKIDAIEPK